MELLLELLASGASREDILKTYPALTDEGLNAAMAYAASVLKNELVWETRIQG